MDTIAVGDACPSYIRMAVSKCEYPTQFSRCFDVIKTIHKGTESEVRLVQFRDVPPSANSPGFAVLKAYFKINLKDPIRMRLAFGEVELLRELPPHPNILGMWCAWETHAEICILMEQMNGDIFGELYEAPLGSTPRKYTKGTPLGLGEDRAAAIIRQVLAALVDLHGSGIVHRDIKTENILKTMTGGIKLGDFGFARYFGEGRRPKTRLGTLQMMSPEILKSTRRPPPLEVDDPRSDMAADGYGPEVDIWALGCVAYELMTGRLPFDGGSFAEMRVLTSKDIEMPPNISPEAQAFLKATIQKDPARRAAAADLVRHPWLVDKPRAVERPRPTATSSLRLPRGYAGAPALGLLRPSLRAAASFNLRSTSNSKSRETSGFQNGSGHASLALGLGSDFARTGTSTPRDDSPSSSGLVGGGGARPPQNLRGAAFMEILRRSERDRTNTNSGTDSQARASATGQPRASASGTPAGSATGRNPLLQRPSAARRSVGGSSQAHASPAGSPGRSGRPDLISQASLKKTQPRALPVPREQLQPSPDLLLHEPRGSSPDAAMSDEEAGLRLGVGFTPRKDRGSNAASVAPSKEGSTRPPSPPHVHDSTALTLSSALTLNVELAESAPTDSAPSSSRGKKIVDGALSAIKGLFGSKKLGKRHEDGRLDSTHGEDAASPTSPTGPVSPTSPAGPIFLIPGAARPKPHEWGRPWRHNIKAASHNSGASPSVPGVTAPPAPSAAPEPAKVRPIPGKTASLPADGFLFSLSSFNHRSSPNRSPIGLLHSQSQNAASAAPIAAAEPAPVSPTRKLGAGLALEEQQRRLMLARQGGGQSPATSTSFRAPIGSAGGTAAAGEMTPPHQGASYNPRAALLTSSSSKKQLNLSYAGSPAASPTSGAFPRLGNLGSERSPQAGLLGSSSLQEGSRSGDRTRMAMRASAGGDLREMGSIPSIAQSGARLSFDDSQSSANDTSTPFMVNPKMASIVKTSSFKARQAGGAQPVSAAFGSGSRTSAGATGERPSPASNLTVPPVNLAKQSSFARQQPLANGASGSTAGAGAQGLARNSSTALRR